MDTEPDGSSQQFSAPAVPVVQLVRLARSSCRPGCRQSESRVTHGTWRVGTPTLPQHGRSSTQPARSRDSAGRSSTLSFKTAIAGCAIWMISDLLLSHLPHQQTSFPTSFSLSPPRWFSTPTPTSLPSALVLRSSRRSTMAPVCLPRCLPSLLANSRQC